MPESRADIGVPKLAADPELRRLAVAQAEKPPQRLIVRRDRQGNAVEYRQEPIDLDFEREVSELHRRARSHRPGL